MDSETDNARRHAMTDSVTPDTNDIEPAEALDVIQTRNFYDPIPESALVAASKHDQNSLVRTIGQRLREARELSNMSQSAAAKRLGYANPSKLSKIEAASDTNSVPLWLICGAARLYEVSVDFLLGQTDDWEVGVPRGTQSWMLDAWDRMRQRDLLALDKVHREVVAVAGGTDAVLSAVRAVSLAVSAYVESNREEFENARGGAAVIYRLGQLEAAASTATVSLRKLKLGAPAASPMP